MNKTLLMAVFLLITLMSKAQLCHYQFAETIAESQNEVTFTIYVFCDSKKELGQAAFLSGIRCVLYDGIPGTKFNKPLLPEGEHTKMGTSPAYFEDLYSIRYKDYVKDCMMLSKFKKSGLEKSTLFQVTIKAFELRKDLEKNNIKTKFGI